MIDGTWFLHKRNRQKIAFGTYIAFGACVLAAGFFGVEGAITIPKTKLVLSAIKQKESDLAMAKQNVRTLPKKATTAISLAYLAVQRFEASAEFAARNAKCTIVQFSSQQKGVQFVSLYKLDGGTHNMVPVNLSIRGNLSHVLAMLQQLISSDSPAEIASIALTPLSADPKETGVNATVMMNIIAQPNPEPTT